MSEEIRTIKTTSCPSLSERSTLTYEIGVKGDKDIQIRLTGNTSSGMYSSSWQSMAQIAVLLSADGKPISSRTIRPIYEGSVNSAGFLLAVLKNEGLIKNIEENSRGYIRCDSKKFTTEIHALMDSVSSQKKPRKLAPAPSTDEGA